MMGRGVPKFTASVSTVAIALTMMIILQAAVPAQARISAAACKEERRTLINACKPVLYGTSPTGQCCLRIRVTHLECVCPIITPKIAALVNVNSLVRLVQGCGRRIPRHYKCGSITTP